MGGLFDDIFDEDWGDIDGKQQQEESENDEFDSGIWKTDSPSDLWNADEPWSSELTPEEKEKQDSFSMKDFFG